MAVGQKTMNQIHDSYLTIANVFFVAVTSQNVNVIMHFLQLHIYLTIATLYLTM